MVLKKIAFILLTCISLMQSKAQVTFATAGAEWTYLFTSMFKPYIFETKINFVSDTILNGDTLKYIFAHFTNKNDNLCNTGGITTLKQKGDTIWFKNTLTNNTWQILYNFAVSAGQNWVTSIYPVGQPSVNYIVQVDSILTKNVNGFLLKNLAVRYFGGAQGIEKTYITERLGCNLFMFNYFVEECATDQPYFREFLCYTDDELGTYQVGNLPCNYVQIMSANFLQQTDQDFDFFPNPATDKLFINPGSLSPGETKITFSDVAGKEIITLFIETSDKELDISDLPGGIYFVSLYAEEKRIGVRKLSVMK